MAQRQSRKIDPCRIFIQGLGRNQTNPQTLKFYFQQYGEVLDATIVRGRSIAFIKFSNASAVKRVLNSGPHIIDGVKVDVKEALQENEQMSRENKMPEKSSNEDSEDSVTKIYLGGICINRTTEQSLAEYFQSFGNVIGVEIKKNSAGVSRGFGFITFDSPSAVKRVMNSKPHVIDSKTVDAKRAIPESATNKGGASHRSSNISSGPQRNQSSSISSRKGADDEIDPCKIFLGGLHYNTVEKDLQDYFGRFGDIVDTIVMRHWATKKSKGFGFVTFAEPYMAEAVLQQQDHLLNGKMISVRIPKPREDKGGPSRSSAPQPDPPQPPSRRMSSPPRRIFENNVPVEADVPKPPTQKTLVIGDCRVDHLKNKTHSSFFKKVDFVSLGEAKLGTIVEEMESRVRSFPYELVIIFSISFDITVLALCPQTNVKVMDLEEDFSIDFLMETIKSLKERWNGLYPNVQFVWTIPYVPDIPRFNSIRLAKVDCWNNPWADRSRMNCKIQLFKCYVESIKTRWDEDSKNTYYVDLNYVMAMGDEAQLANLRDSLDDSVVCKVEDTVDGLNPSKCFVTKFWNQIHKLEEFMAKGNISPPPKIPSEPSIRDTWKAGDDSPSDSWGRNDRSSSKLKREDDEPRRIRPSGRLSRFSSNVPEKEDFHKRSRSDYDEDEYDKGKRQSFERDRKYLRDSSLPKGLYSAKEDLWNKPYSSRSSPPKNKALLATPYSRDRDSDKDHHKRPAFGPGSSRSLLDKPHFSQFQGGGNMAPSLGQHSGLIGEAVKNAASAAIQSQLASQMEHLLPDMIKGVTEKICAEVMKSMQNKPVW